MENRNMLAEVIYSSVMSMDVNSKTGKIFSETDFSQLPKIISFDMVFSTSLTVFGKNFTFDIEDGKQLENSFEVIELIKQKIDKCLKGKGLEFVYQDAITKSVCLFSEDYINKLESKEIPLGELVLNYYRQWYNLKCGEGRHKTRKHHERYSTFSQREIEYLRRTYMPIIVISKELAPVYNLIETIIELSPIKEYVIKDSGYDVHGRKVDQSISYWLPREVAKAYLGVQTDEEAIYYDLLKKLVLEAGFLGKPAVQNKNQIPEMFFDSVKSKREADDYILSRNNFTRERTVEKEVSRLISADATVDDADKIQGDAELVELDWR